jgi:hypothetical protein
MPTRRVAVVAAGLVAAGLAVTNTVVAPAASAAAAPTYLVLTVNVSGDRPLSATLRCDPPRGTHPKPTAACTAVASANGHLRSLAPRTGVMCTAVYRPATATARGTWRGHSVQYRKTFSNSCVLGVETGAVFQF